MIKLIGILFLSIEILVLKNISYDDLDSLYTKEYKKFKLKIWHLFILIPLNLYWVLSIVFFIICVIMFFSMYIEKYVKINYNKDSPIFKFLNKEL